jgi:hypothetical protein
MKKTSDQPSGFSSFFCVPAEAPGSGPNFARYPLRPRDGMGREQELTSYFTDLPGFKAIFCPH